MTDDPKAWGKQVQEWREKIPLTRDGMGRLIGVTGTTIYRVESGRRDPGETSAILIDLLMEQDETLWWLIGRRGVASPKRSIENHARAGGVRKKKSKARKRKETSDGRATTANSADGSGRATAR